MKFFAGLAIAGTCLVFVYPVSVRSVGVDAQTTLIDQKQERQSSDEFIITKLGGHEFHIPKGYFDPFNGFPDHIDIRALMPCLVPERADNTIDLHKYFVDDVMFVHIMVWDKKGQPGERSVEWHLRNSLSVKEHDWTIKDSDFSARKIPGTQFSMLRDLLFSQIIYVKNDSDPLFVLECQGHSFCSVHDIILGNLLLTYRYHWSYLGTALDANNLEFSATIDDRIQTLIRSFTAIGLKDERPPQVGACK